MATFDDYAAAVTTIDGLPDWHATEELRLRTEEQQARLKAEADARRRRDVVADQRKQVESAITEARRRLAEVGLESLVPTSVHPQPGSQARGADDLSRSLDTEVAELRRLCRTLQSHREEAGARRAAEAEAERERQRQAEEARRRQDEYDALVAARQAWIGRRDRARIIGAGVGVAVLLVLSVVGLAVGLVPLVLVGLVAGAGAFFGVFSLMKPEGTEPDLPPQP